MNLSPREWDVLVGTAEGLTDEEIGARLYITAGTVKMYARLLRARLGARNRAHAVSIAYQRGLLATSFEEVAA
jgi:DNA-binding NarL/FixJ family response regulator